MVQNGSKVSKMGPKWVPKGVKKGSKRGSQRGSQRSEPKQSRTIFFFLWPQSTKKVTHVPVFEEKKIFLRKKSRKKFGHQKILNTRRFCYAKITFFSNEMSCTGSEKNFRRKFTGNAQNPQKVPKMGVPPFWPIFQEAYINAPLIFADFWKKCGFSPRWAIRRPPPKTVCAESSENNMVFGTLLQGVIGPPSKKHDSGKLT